MIVFEKVRWKNFLSTGDDFLEIPLNDVHTTIFTGKSGSGKSQLLDGLTLCLFNKPFRQINKDQLINSINKNNCLVEVEFRKGKKRYLVRRGMKPNIFEVHCDDVLLPQDGNSRDYQLNLEKNILGMNLKTFQQIVILGAANFTPFMRLPAGDRRQIIEDLLDIRVFSTMADIVKERRSLLKQSLQDSEHSINLLVERIKLQKEHLDSLQKKNEVEKKRLHDRVESFCLEIEEKEEEMIPLKSELKKVGDEKKKFQQKLDEMILKIKKSQDDIERAEEMLQESEKKHRIAIGDYNKSIKNCDKEIADLEKKLETVSKPLEKIDSLKEDIRKLEEQRSEKESKWASIDSEIIVLQDKSLEYSERKTFLNLHDICETCNQKIAKSFREKSISEIDEKIKELTEKIAERVSLKDESTKAINRLNEKIEKLEGSIEELEEVRDEVIGLESAISDVHGGLRLLREEKERAESSFVEVQDVKAEQISLLKSQAKSLQKEKESFEKTDVVKVKENELKEQIAEIQREIKSLHSQKKSCEDDLKELEKPQKEVTDLKKSLKAEATKLKAEKELREELLQKKELYATTLGLLKDDAIKSCVIQQYLPVINKSINKYLNDMDFFVEIELDENFNETILSRQMDDFKYSNLSSGEMQRLDLAFLFTWRMVSKLKNSMSTNLLIMDETFDSYLDTSATENVIKILDTETFDNHNVFVISHKDTISELFDKQYRFEKVSNFTRIN